MKYIIMVPDGAADYPVHSLGGKTPLQASGKPNMDRLAREGRCGLFKTIPDDFSTGSAVANLSILGYDPFKYFQGRGVLEAASMGIPLEKDDIALRCNTICIEDGKIRSHSAGHISTTESRELIGTIDEKLGTSRIKFHPGIDYRHLLVLKGGYSPELECFPPHDYVGRSVKELMIRPKAPEAVETANLLNRLILDSMDILKRHPVNRKRASEGKQEANSIWPWSPGRKPAMETFQERFGIRGAVISAVDLINGLGIYSGFDVIHVEGATGLHTTNYEGKAEAAVMALKDHDFVYVHVEASDEAGHDGDLDLKIKCIEYFDRRLVGNILKCIDPEETVLAVIPDHPTPVAVRGHTSEPVPFIIKRPGEKPDSVERFDEESCGKGSYGLLEKDAFIKTVLGESEGKRET